MDSQSHYLVFPPDFVEPLQSIGIPSDLPLSLVPHEPSSVTTSQRKNIHDQGESYGRATTINILPDDVLLDIFDFYKEYDDYKIVRNWDVLVHVCRRWRQVVFASPLRLDLKIICVPGNPVRKNLGIWPALPIAIRYVFHTNTNDDEDNIVAAFEHVDRVCHVSLHATGLELEKIFTAMLQTFSMLTYLYIGSGDGPVLPAEFLGGSAPHLHEIELEGISFPELPTLLLSASDLVSLNLEDIPPTGYISPKAMVMGLAALPRLELFVIGFQLATSRPDRIHPPPVTRTILPALTTLGFTGASEYIEDLAARIDAPQLGWILIYYMNQRFGFQVAQLSRFIDRSVGPPKLTRFKYARVGFHSRQVTFYMYNETGSYHEQLSTTISCQRIGWQVFHMIQLLSQFSTTLSLSAAVNLKLEVETKWVRPTEGMVNVDLQHLLLQFSTMQTLYVSRGLAEHVGLALEHLDAGAFPSLHLIFLEGQPASSVEKFLATRKFSGRPVTVVDTEREFKERVKVLIPQQIR